MRTLRSASLLPLCVAGLLFSTNLMAQAEDEAASGEVESKAGPSMESEGDDPVDSEVAEADAPFVPRGKEKAGDAAEDDSAARSAARMEKPLAVHGDVLFGFGQTPLPGPVDLRSPDATAISLVIGASYAVQPNLSLGLDLPWTTASFDSTADQSQIDESANALGNPMLRLEYRLVKPSFDIPLRFGVGIPVAQGEPDPTSADRAKIAQTQVQLTADAARAWREGEYYAVGRMPVTLGAGIEFPGTFEFSAAETLLLAPKIRGEVSTPEALPNGETKLNSFAMRSVTDVAAAYQIIELLGAGLRGSLVYNIIDAVDYTPDSDVTQPSPLQLSLEPHVRATFSGITASVGYLVPLGGQLGDAKMSGLRLGAAARF
ncbi:MAG: hypothetical protein H6718_11900 [Polyangiaceae bacterium]|nr:hypothetical protein [Myxococcales bacterium]MCB9586095.1 hypothetical protein [Polyangiaceae bacterium]MCB9608888.1 hypothetical protein [Polyangiaceae bacterium]